MRLGDRLDKAGEKKRFEGVTRGSHADEWWPYSSITQVKKFKNKLLPKT